MVPSFVLDTQNIYKVLGATAEATRNDWKDEVAKRFYDKYIEEYKEATDLYIYGRYGSRYVYGQGLSDILKLFDESQNEMAQLGGMDTNFGSDYEVHNDRRERLHYASNVVNPSELDTPEVKGIMNKRDKNW